MGAAFPVTPVDKNNNVIGGAGGGGGPTPSATSMSVTPASDAASNPFPVVGNVADAVVDSGASVKVGGLVTSTTPALTAGRRAPLYLDLLGNLRVVPADAAGRTAGLPTYVATTTGYAAYTTPQDMFAIFGSATKTVAVTRFVLVGSATAATLAAFQFIRRSAANTGGTPTPLAIIKNDSANAAPTAAPVVYGSAPTPGASVGVISYVSAALAATATNPGTPVGPFQGAATNGPLGLSTSLLDLRQPIVLRGVAEGLVVNFAGGTLPGGFTANAFAEWIEY